MATVVDATMVQFTIFDFVDQACGIRAELKEWISGRNHHLEVDQQALHLGQSIDNLTDTIKQKWDELASNLEPEHIASIESIAKVNEYLKQQLPRVVEGVKLRNLSTSDVEAAIEKEAEPLGSGRFGVVYRGKLYGQEVAIKILSHKNESGESVLDSAAFRKYVKDIFREILPPHFYPAENILQLLAYSFDETYQTKSCLVFPYMPNGSLYDKLNPDRNRGVDNQPLTWEQRGNIALGVARGLTHLHSIPIMHGDIKSTNILLDKNLEPKIGDFGGVTHLTLSTHYTIKPGDSVCGTRDYLPDDYLRSLQARVQVDVFSFGMLLLELMSGKYPGYKIGNVTFRDIITRVPKTPGPKDWFDNASGLEPKPFTFWAMSVQGGFEMSTTTLPEQFFMFGTVCAKNDYKKRPNIGHILNGLNKSINEHMHQTQSYILASNSTMKLDVEGHDEMKRNQA